MKLKAFFLVCFLGLSAPLFAANQHVHANAQGTTEPSAQQAADSKKVKMGWPGYCEIEIINHSYDDVRVYGVFDDGIALEPFSIYSYESPHYISLYYYGYCHAGMDLYIDTFYGAHVYAGYVSRYSTIRIVPSLFGGKLEAQVQGSK